MEHDYYEVTAELDAREILRYLNNLGIINISGEVLKYFITDLKKLIKYDLESQHKSKDNHRNNYVPGPERLHSASTFSSRVRSKVHEGAIFKCSKECDDKRIRSLYVRHIQSAPNIAQKTEEKPLRRACSCIRVEKKPESQDTRDKATTSSNSNLIKVPKQKVPKKCDPVALYHYYTSLWAKYKPNVPGENDWADLRWKVRQKMAGCTDDQVPYIQLGKKENKVSTTRS